MSPGVLLVMPLRDNLQVLMGSEAMAVPQGMSLLVAGSSPKALLPEWRRDEEPGPAIPVRLVEVAALLNGAIPLREHLDLPCLLDYETSTRLERLYEQLFLTGDTLRLPGVSTDVYGPFLRMDLVMTLLVANERFSTTPSPSNEDARVLKLKRFLMENVANRVSASEMASHMGMSVKTLTRWSRKMLGAPPAQYFKELRLQKALEFMSQGTPDIESIAERTGFPDRYYFSREFKRRFGSPPARFRKALRTVPTVDLLEPANEYFRRAQFKWALHACERGILLTTSSAVREQFLYLQGRCLRATGRMHEAVEVWANLRYTAYAHKAGVEQCRSLFALGQRDRARERLRDLYTEADETQKQDVVRLWMDEAVSLFTQRRARQLKEHMALRGDLFPNDLTSMRLSVDALRALQENEEVLHQCASIRSACFHALRRAGKLDEAIRRFGNPHEPAALLAFGRYEDASAALTEECPPALKANVLVGLGRAKDAIDDYPDHCQLALFKLGRYEELLERSPEISFLQVYALHALGRSKTLETLSRDDPAPWLHAQLCVCPERILESTLPDALTFRGRARLLMAIDALQGGRRREAECILEPVDGIRSPDLWWEDHTSAELFLLCILRGYLFGEDQRRADLDHVVRNFRFRSSQVLWHNAAYLTGAIGKREYRAQPAHAGIDARFTFIQALAHDIAGKRSLAGKTYESLVKQAVPSRSSELLRHRFAGWQLQELHRAG